MPEHWTDGIYSDGSEDFVAVKAQPALIRLRCYGESPVGQVYLCTNPDGERRFIPMHRASEQDGFTYWEGELELGGPRISYRFRLDTPDAQVWYNQAGTYPFDPSDEHDFALVGGHEPPSWLWSAVFYQIFPDRFCDGDPANNVRDGEYLYQGHPVIARRWGELPTRGQGHLELYGGDLEGIRQRIPYLQQLGVTALWLTPIFQSPSSHKYDTQDYTQVDSHFGGNQALIDLVADLRRAGIRLVLDGVFNHTGDAIAWFNKAGLYPVVGAYQDPKGSPYAAMYRFTSDDQDSYYAWLAVPSLPVLNYDSDLTRELIYRAPDAIARRWLQPPYSADGWRLDVANMLAWGPHDPRTHQVFRELRQAVREANPDAYIVGEHFFEATPWLQGFEEDGAMNYFGFTWPILGFIAGQNWRFEPTPLAAQDLDRALLQARAKLAHAFQLSQYNLLGSHDTPRALTVCRGNRRRFALAVLLLFTYIGVPAVYYGDEIGLEGGPDPDCRRCMEWDRTQWDRGLWNTYHTLIQLRRRSSALQRGGYRTLLARGDLFAFARTLGAEQVVTIVNRGPAKAVQVPLRPAGINGGTFRDVLTGRSYQARRTGLRLELGEDEGVVLERMGS